MSEQTKSAPAQAKLVPVPSVFARPHDPCETRAIPWTVTDETPTGLTSLNAREMRVPMDDSPESMGVRQHEMLHAALSPMTVEQLDMPTLAAEDGRIETLATLRGIKRKKVLTRDQIREVIHNAASDDFQLASVSVASVGAPHERIVKTALKGMGRDDVLALMTAASEAFREDESFASSERVADMIRAFAEPPPEGKGSGDGDSEDDDSEPQDGDGEGQDGSGNVGPPPPPKSGRKPLKPRKPGKGKPAMPMAHAPRPNPAKATPARTEESEPQPTPEPKQDNRADGIRAYDMPKYMRDSQERFGHEERPENNWAPDVIVETPKRSQRLVQKGRGRGKASDTGTVPKRLSRMTVDQKVFGASRNKKRGTVLLDLSGSTSYLHEITGDIIRQIPAAVVAGYWGNGDGSGTIRVMAANGKMVSDRDLIPDGALNEIDGPAVAWLAAQAAPRLWVFDGGATGKGDDPSLTRAMRREMDYHVQAARIKIIDPNNNRYGNEYGGSDDESLARLTADITATMK